MNPTRDGSNSIPGSAPIIYSAGVVTLTLSRADAGVKRAGGIADAGAKRVADVEDWPNGAGWDVSMGAGTGKGWNHAE